jgi:hypothetical protein
MSFSPFRARLAGFARDNRGYVSAEAIILLPLLLWLFGAGWVYFDAFRQQSVAQKANYVIGDMISRETDPIDGTYISNARRLLNLLTQARNAETDLRVTVVRYDSDRAEWEVVWSKKRGDYARLRDADLADYQDRLPPAMDQEQLILVETWEDYVPVFEVGLGAFEIHSYSFTSPRYAPQIPFSNS